MDATYVFLSDFSESFPVMILNDADVKDVAEGALMDEVDSWMTGINHNVGKSTRYVARYSGSIQQFRQVCNGVKENKYNTFKLA